MADSTSKAHSLLKQKPLVESFLNTTSSPLSSRAFVNIFLWQNFFTFVFKIIENNLCVFAQNTLGSFLYMPPLGKTISPKTIFSCFKIMEDFNKNIARIENVSSDQLHYFSKKEFSFYKKDQDYVYTKNDIISLKGQRYKSKRASRNQFTQNYSFCYLPYEQSMKDECLALYDQWAKSRQKNNVDEIYGQMLQESREAHQLAFHHYQDLNLIGRVILIHDRISAYTFGFELEDTTFCVLLEITDLTIKGLATFIFSQFCNDPQLKKYTFINVMDDCALPNMQRTKMSFRPTLLHPSYIVTKHA